MGRGRRGPIDQSKRKTKASGGLIGRRGNPKGYFLSMSNREAKETFISEQALEFMKNMNPQQLFDFLLQDDDDCYIKTLSGNASGN